MAPGQRLRLLLSSISVSKPVDLPALALVYLGT
jgi:hypothetical protein